MKDFLIWLGAPLLACGSLAAQGLPAAPAPRGIPAYGAGSITSDVALLQPLPAAEQMVPASTPEAGQQSLTLAQAELMAIRNNPRVTVGRLLALAQHQVTREARAAELPTANGAITAEDAEEGSRTGAGSLTSSRLLEHAGAGFDGTQLIFDFGHAHNLVLAQKLSEKASNANALATTEEIVLATDEAFYGALTAQAELDVARETVNARQATESQVGAMTKNKLKSTLDLSFADVDLSQAQLLQLDAQSNANASMAVLDAVLGLDHDVAYRLDEGAGAPPPPASQRGAAHPDCIAAAAGPPGAELRHAVGAEICPRAVGSTAAHGECRRNGGADPSALGYLLHNELVGSGGRQCERADFQWISLYFAGAGSKVPCAGGGGEKPRSARPHCARRAHIVAADE
jgi:hypothetical protein